MLSVHAIRLAAAVAAAVALATVFVPSVDAHERRTVAGRYTFVVGFLEEPALLEQPNGIDLRITNAQTNEPVEGVERTLKADLIAGGQTKTVELRARFGQRGAYTASVIPTKTGTWVFRFYGEIEGIRIDERFESGPGRFNDVENPATLQFPVMVPSVGELAGQRASGEAGARSETAPDVQRALDEAASARRIGIGFGLAGLAAGVLGLGLAAYALTSRRREGRSRGGRSEPV